MKRQTSTEPIYIDPVCLKTVTNDKKDSTGTYQFRTYYFCTPVCRKAFEKNPDRYLDLKIQSEKGLWVRYLDRLKQVAGMRKKLFGRNIKAAKSGLAASGGMSTVSMAACCTHYLVPLLPVLGLPFLSAAANCNFQLRLTALNL